MTPLNGTSKVVHLTSVHSPFDVRVFYKECRSLARAGYNVVLIAPHTHDLVAEGVQIRAVPKVSARLVRMTKVTGSVYRRALQERGTIYHFHDPELIGIGLLLAAQGKSVIYDIHEDCPADILDKHYLPVRARGILSRTLRCVEDLSVPRFRALVAATSAIASRFSGHTSIVTVHNYPLLAETHEIHSNGAQPRRPSVAYFGGLTAERGIRELIQAIDLLAPEIGTVLELAGPHSPPSFREELRCLSGWSKVRDWGLLTREQLTSLLGCVAVGALLYKDVPNNVLSEPNKLFEYMAAGIPVVASDYPLWRSIIMDLGCGLVVPPCDIRAIAGALEHLLTHPAEASAMGERGRRAVLERFNWEREEQILLYLYSQIAGSAPARGCY